MTGNESPMKMNSDGQTSKPSKFVKEISETLWAYTRFFIGVGILAILGAAVLDNYRFASTFGVGGTILLLLGILLGILTQGFRRLQRWTYPIVKVLVGTMWGLNTAYADSYPQKIRSAEVRRAFGLEPLPESEPEDNESSPS